MNDFASLENKAAAEAERAAIAQIASLESQVAEQAAALKELQREATAAQISVRDKEAEVVPSIWIMNQEGVQWWNMQAH